MRVKNATKDLVWLGDELIIPGETIEPNARTDLLLNDALSDGLRRLVGAGLVRVLPDPEPAVHR
jgi:hypothetical protein